MSAMTAISAKVTNYGRERQSRPFLLQVTMLTWRSLVTIFRTPAAVIPTLLISAFFLFVYNASLGNASNFLPGLAGKSYLGFILPVSVVSAALSGAGVAGQSIVRDLENGYFDKLPGSWRRKMPAMYWAGGKLKFKLSFELDFCIS